MANTLSMSLVHHYPQLPTEACFGIRILGIGPGEAVAFYEHGPTGEVAVLMHLKGGQATRYELPIPSELLLKRDFGAGSPVIMKMAGQLLLFLNTRLIYLIDTNLRVIREITIDNDLPYLAELYSSPDKPHRPENFTGFSDTNIVPLFFPGNRILTSNATRYMALLQIDIETEHAQWRLMGSQILFRLERADFPPTTGSQGPYVHHAVYRGGKLLVYTIGNNSGYIKWGMEYFGLSVFDENLKLVEHVFLDYPSDSSTRKHGRMGDFTSSLKYCILTPLYPTSDPWKRSQRLLDINDWQLYEVGLPRGFSKYKIVEHCHDTFWLLSTEDREHFAIASCRAHN